VCGGFTDVFEDRVQVVLRLGRPEDLRHGA
jgi:hypothetical protein